jgi:hypothetical protein
MPPAGSSNVGWAVSSTLLSSLSIYAANPCDLWVFAGSVFCNTVLHLAVINFVIRVYYFGLQRIFAISVEYWQTLFEVFVNTPSAAPQPLRDTRLECDGITATEVALPGTITLIHQGRRFASRPATAIAIILSILVAVTIQLVRR